jgi:hypothetical protein
MLSDDHDALSHADAPPDGDRKVMPDGLSRLDELPDLTDAARRLLARIQGRTYANMLHVVECFVSGVADLGPAAREWLRTVERAAATGTPETYRFVVSFDCLVNAAQGRCPWSCQAAALALALQAQAHYRSSLAPGDPLSSRWRALFLENWRRAAPRAVRAEQAWVRADAAIDAAEQAAAVADLLALLATLDAAVQSQAAADAACFLGSTAAHAAPAHAIRALLQRAYRWQYVGIAIQEARFVALLQSLLDPAALRRVRTAVAPLLTAVR